MKEFTNIQEEKQIASSYTRIICPVDFSEAAMNAIEYAVRLAHKFSTELYLINIKPLLFSQFIGGNADKLRENIEDVQKKLVPICEQARKIFDIPCKSAVLVAHDQLEKIISSAIQERNLLVMGTNGIDELYQYFFSTHTFKVIQKTKRPVLMIPENVFYSDITEVTYALSNKEPLAGLRQAISFAKPFSAKIHFLYITEGSEIYADDDYLKTVNEIEKMLYKKNIRYYFEQVYSDDIADTINQHMISKKNNVLILPVEKRSITEAIFRKNSIKKIAVTASYPVLFIHANEME